MKPPITSIAAGLRKWPVWVWLARQDIKARYRGSLLGPVWLVLNLGIMIAGLSAVYGAVFGLPLREYVPYLAAGFISWWFISGCLTESCAAFVENSQLIANQPLPLAIYVFRVSARHSFLLAHNLIVFVVVALIFARAPTPCTLLVLPGFALLVLLMTSSGLTLAILCARFRDIPHIVASALQIAMLVTPVMFMKEMLHGREFIARANPLYHCVEIVRAPLLGQAPHASTWAWLLATNAISAALAIWLMRRAGHRIPYLV